MCVCCFFLYSVSTFYVFFLKKKQKLKINVFRLFSSTIFRLLFHTYHCRRVRRPDVFMLSLQSCLPTHENIKSSSAPRMWQRETIYMCLLWPSNAAQRSIANAHTQSASEFGAGFAKASTERWRYREIRVVNQSKCDNLKIFQATFIFCSCQIYIFVCTNAKQNFNGFLLLMKQKFIYFY